MMLRLRRAVWVALPLCLLSASCSQERPGQVDKRSSPSQNITPGKDPGTPGELVVSVATSAREVMEELATRFSERSGTTVRVSAGPSNRLASQVQEGAPYDFLLTASSSLADKVNEAGVAAMMLPLLTNQLAIVVPRGNPGDVTSANDLASDKVKKVALSEESTPAGQYAGQALTRLGVLSKLTDAGKIVRGTDVRSALDLVERGEAEAGIVYATDVAAARNVESVGELDPSLHDEIVYVLVLLKHGTGKPAARQFFEFLRSADAREVFAKAGFQRIGRR